MKRDMNLIRSILMEIEDIPYDMGFHEIEVEGHSPEEISYHVMLLDEAGLIDAEDLSSFSGPQWAPKRLTWEGHEFIEASRDEKRWNAAKNAVATKGGGLVFEVLKQLLVSGVRDAVFGSGQ